MENPKYPYKEHPTVAFCFECPNCGDPIPWQVVWLMNDYWHGLKHCPNCGAALPDGETREEALAAAMKRDRAKGEWISKGENAFEWCDYECSACGQAPDYFVYGTENWGCGELPNFCPNCGADMRKEKDDEQ